MKLPKWYLFGITVFWGLMTALCLWMNWWIGWAILCFIGVLYVAWETQLAFWHGRKDKENKR